jgi:hypothetical protein
LSDSDNRQISHYRHGLSDDMTALPIVSDNGDRNGERVRRAGQREQRDRDRLTALAGRWRVFHFAPESQVADTLPHRFGDLLEPAARVREISRPGWFGSGARPGIFGGVWLVARHGQGMTSSGARTR